MRIASYVSDGLNCIASGETGDRRYSTYSEDGATGRRAPEIDGNLALTHSGSMCIHAG